jgi:hypothetical protein
MLIPMSAGSAVFPAVPKLKNERPPATWYEVLFIPYAKRAFDQAWASSVRRGSTLDDPTAQPAGVRIMLFVRHTLLMLL